jgi:hypothetical protein
MYDYILGCFSPRQVLLALLMGAGLDAIGAYSLVLARFGL